VKRPIAVAAGLVFRGGLLLITQRRADDHLGGLWEFPGGKIEPFESPEECVIRELREELAIEVEVIGLTETIVHDYPEKTVALQFFHCRCLRGEAQPLGCQALAWVRREQLSTYSFPAADAQLLARLEHEDQWWTE